MDNETRLDKSLRWIKNNKFLSAIMLAGLVVVGASQLVASLATLIHSGREIVAPNKTTDNALGSNANIDGKWGRPFGTVIQKLGAACTGPSHFDDARYGAVNV